MSYQQAMKWQTKHRKGTRQPVLMSTGSGFWPSHGFLVDYWDYVARCEVRNITPLECEAYYNATLRNGPGVPLANNPDM